MQKAVFIKRDGFFNEYVGLGKKLIAPRAIEKFKLIRETKTQIEQLVKAGFIVFIITHQPGVSLGEIPRKELDKMHAVIDQYFSPIITDILVCMHEEDEDCPCCSPRPGLLLDASHAHRINLAHSFVISDRWQDSKAAWEVNCTSIQTKSCFNGKTKHDHLVDDFEHAVEKVLTLDKKTS